MDVSLGAISSSSLPKVERRSYGAVSSQHKHEYHQVVLPRTGVMEIEIAGFGGGRVDRTQAAFVPKEALHEFESSKGSEFVVLDISTNHFMGLRNGYCAIDYLVTKTFFPMTARLEHLVAYAASFEPQEGKLPVSGAWASLFIEDTVRVVSETLGLQQGSLSKACNFIETHLGETLSVAQIARVAGMSTRSLHSLFRDKMQTTPYAYLMLRRTARALLLLENTSKSIGEIAFLTGHADQSALTHTLKKFHGITPAAYRRHCATKD